MRTPSTCCAVALALLTAGCKAPKPEAVESGDLNIQVAISPDPPRTGENRLTVEVRDAAGRPVDGARLEFLYDMAAMGSMPEMKGGGTVVAHGNGQYEITYPLAMQGTWALTLEVRAAGHPLAEVRMQVAPPRPGLTLDQRGPHGADGGSGAATVLDIPTRRQQLIGVTYGKVDRRPLSLHVRAPGRVEVDETQLSEVTLKYEAYVEKLFVSQTGQPVKAGTPLLTLYSPELLTAEQDYLLARKGAAVGTAGSAELLRAAEQRLRLWGVDAGQLAELARQGKAEPRLTLRSSGGGVVLEKNVVEGSRVMAGNTLYRIGNLGRIWVQADLPEWDAPHLGVGQPAMLNVPWSTAAISGRVSFISPTVDEKTRSLHARLEFANPGLVLKPGMFVDVLLEVPLGVRLTAPESAVLVSGEHRYAFVSRGEGRLQPVEVKTGAASGGRVEVLAGLAEGDAVATGATFLLSSEAQLRDALPRWSAP